jgi:L-threonylcarbamoyladenylate synthase
LGLKLVNTQIISCPLDHPDPDVIRHAAEIIINGGLVVYPTDTLYGLGGDPGNPDAVDRIFMVKGRSRNKPLPLILYHRDDLKNWTRDIPPLSEKLMHHFWPGPLTILFPVSEHLSPMLTAGTGKIGLRWPRAPVATAIARKAGTAIIATSANPSGKGGIIYASDIVRDLKGLVDLIIDAGDLEPSEGSTIVDATGGHIRIIRKGAIPADTLKAIEENEKED